MKIIYSYNKTGYEADYWDRELQAASGDEYTVIPFNHGVYLNPRNYLRAQLLDNLYFEKHPQLLRMYRDCEAAIGRHKADVLLVDNCHPYHPEFLWRLQVYKVLRTSDGPLSSYERDFAYAHAYDHILFHSPAYSEDVTMQEKLRRVGARRADFWPLALFDAQHDAKKSVDNILSGERDIDIVFVGSLVPNKMPVLAAVKKAFGRRFKIFGLSGIRKNLYFNVHHHFPSWVRPIAFEDYVSIYQRSKIGINVHNRGKFTVGSYRLFDLPGNGVMQISDGGEYLQKFFEVPSEVESYDSIDELIEKLRYYLQHHEKRNAIAMNGFTRVRRDYGISSSLSWAARLIADARARLEPVANAFP